MTELFIIYYFLCDHHSDSFILLIDVIGQGKAFSNEFMLLMLDQFDIFICYQILQNIVCKTVL